MRLEPRAREAGRARRATTRVRRPPARGGQAWRRRGRAAEPRRFTVGGPLKTPERRGREGRNENENNIK